MTDEPRQSRLTHYTPLRYPGGKGKLAEFIKRIMRDNKLLDGEYVEPYAGGAAVALELLFHEYVSAIHINDINKAIYSFWASVLNDTDAFCKKLHDTKVTVRNWDKQKKILHDPESGTLELGFAAFFLNRTNRSGILNGGIIGGRDQEGPWKIDARFNRAELTYRIEQIAKLRDRIHLTRKDAVKFLASGIKKWPKQTLIYCDPPYYIKGRELYYDFYEHDDHASVAELMKNSVKDQKWIVSYDNVIAISRLYAGFKQIIYSVGYSARDASRGAEIMFFSGQLNVPPLAGPLTLITPKPSPKKPQAGRARSKVVRSQNR